MGMVYVSTRSGATSIEDAQKKEYLIAASGSNSGPAVFARILNTMINSKFKVVRGYAGSADAMLAVENGEADGRITSGWAGPERSKATAWVAAGTARLLMQISVNRSPDYPTLPNIMDYARDDADRQVLEYLLTGQSIGNPFIAAPGIPQDRASYLKKAFMSVVTDPGFLADAKKQLLVVGPVTGEQLEEIVERAYSTPPELRNRAQDIYNSAQN
jgi:tripartite-type tricarboxylate transporter receptor subunit TctC